MLRRSPAVHFFSSLANGLRDKLELDRAAQAEADAKAYEAQRAASVDDAYRTAVDGGIDVDPRTARASRAPRSALFVPCSNLKAMKKIPQLKADVFILDLEDSVSFADKAKARGNLIEFVSSGYDDGSLLDKRLIVRINSPTFSKDTIRFGVEDMDAVSFLGERIEGIGIPKTSARDADLIRESIHPLHSVWAFLETPQSIIQANEILKSRFYSVAAMGLNDLSMELQLPLDYHMSTGKKGGNKAAADGTTATEAAAPAHKAMFARRLPLLYHMSTVINAARAYNVHPMDGVFNDPTDTLGYLAEVQEAKSLGFSGKTLIHPNQIEALHKVYAPTTEEVEWARRVTTALHESQGGVAVVDGKMIEELHGRMARRILVNAALDEEAAEGAEDDAEFERRARRQARAERYKPIMTDE